jgi:hypothetical protein
MSRDGVNLGFAGMIPTVARPTAAALRAAAFSDCIGNSEEAAESIDRKTPNFCNHPASAVVEENPMPEFESPSGTNLNLLVQSELCIFRILDANRKHEPELSSITQQVQSI